MAFKNKTWATFSANLLGIILGITLTFGVNELWQKHEEKEKTREMLILIRNELEINKEWFEKQEETLKSHAHVYSKILEVNKKWETIPQDSIQRYSQLLSLQIYDYHTLAWQIFQNSDIIQKLSDKELVFRLTSCYYDLNVFHDIIMKNYWDKKMDEMPNDRDYHAVLDGIVDGKKESYRFLRFIAYSDFWDSFTRMYALIDYNISLLDKYGNLKYNMEEKNKEFETFLEKRMENKEDE